MSAPTPRRIAIWLVIALSPFTIAACSGQDSAPHSVADGGAAGVQVTVSVPPLSDKAQAGRIAFNANCALCHGPNAAGSSLGPPLVHKIYEPGHHQDFAFRNAAQRGVQSHHWQFGDMPPVPAVSENDVERIICYIRELQRANGVFDNTAGLAACQS